MKPAALSKNLAYAFQGCPDPILVLSKEFLVTTTNDAYLKLINTARRDILGKPIFSIAPYVSAPEIAEKLRKSLVALANGRKLETGSVGEHPDGFANWRVEGTDGEFWIIHRRSQVLTSANRAVTNIAHTVRRIEQALSSSGVTIFVQDKHRRYRWISSPAFGFEVEALIGKMDEDIFPEAIRINAIELKERALRSRGPVQASLKSVDGEKETWWRLSAESFRDEKGQVAGLIGTTIDITHEKLRESALQRLAEERQNIAERFAIALRGAKVSVSVQDVQRRFQWMSENSLFTDCALDGNIGAREEDFMTEALCNSVVQLKEAVLATGEAKHGEFEIGSWGKETWIRMRVEPRRNDNQKIIGLITCTVDITEEKRAQREIMHTTALLRAMSAATPDLISVKDRSGRWLFANPAFLASQKKSWAEVRGKTDVEIYSDLSEATNYMENDRRVMRSQIPEVIEERSKSGSIVYLSTKAPLFNESGEVIGVVGISTDVTERKREEERKYFLLRELQHRSKNLLAVIQSIARQSISTSTSLVDFEHRFTARLAGLSATHDLLTHHDWKGASLGELVRSHLSAKDIADGRFQIDGPNVYLKPSAVQHIGLVLHELMSNALKYGALSRPEGRILIRWLVETEAECDKGEIFKMRWQEMNGPPVKKTDRRGFGRLITERIISSAVDGLAELDFDAAGVVWTLEMPTASIVQD